jgi:transposase
VSDAKSLLPQMEKLRTDFGLEEVVLVGDRGMIGQAHIETLRQSPDLSWITALKRGQIRRLVEQEALPLGLFDERNFAVDRTRHPKMTLNPRRHGKNAEVRRGTSG